MMQAYRRAHAEGRISTPRPAPSVAGESARRCEATRVAGRSCTQPTPPPGPPIDGPRGVLARSPLRFD
jgi:hypothetical protein